MRRIEEMIEQEIGVAVEDTGLGDPDRAERGAEIARGAADRGLRPLEGEENAAVRALPAGDLTDEAVDKESRGRLHPQGADAGQDPASGPGGERRDRATAHLGERDGSKVDGGVGAERS